MKRAEHTPPEGEKKMKEIKTVEMTEKEIAESLKLFGCLLKKGDKVANIGEYNPIKENAYTSSSYIIGVFFPNNRGMTLKGFKHYEICALSKVGDSLGVCLSLKDDTAAPLLKYYDNYIFLTFKELLYSREYLEIEEQYIKNIKQYKKDVSNLESVKRLYKKDGGEFARLADNFSEPLTINMSLFGSFISSLCFRINSNNYYLYLEEQKEKITAGEVWELLQKKKEQYLNLLKQEESNYKKFKKDFSKVEKARDHLVEVLRSCDSYKYDKMIKEIGFLARR